MVASGESLKQRALGWAVGVRNQLRLDRARRMLARSRLFDPQWYRAAYGLAPEVDALADCLTGPAERRPSPWFDAAWYLRRNLDVANSGLHPLAHYVLFGAREMRDPNPSFSTRWYLASHPQAARSLTPLDHYVARAATELPDPAPDFDAAWYAAHQMADNPAGLDPLAHYLLVGRAAGARTQPFQPAAPGDPVELARLETFKPLDLARGQMVALVAARAVDGRLSSDARAIVEGLAAAGARVALLVEADAPFAPDPNLVHLLAGGFVRERRGHRAAALAHVLRSEPLLFSGETLLVVNGDAGPAPAGDVLSRFLRNVRESRADVLANRRPGWAGERLDIGLIAFQRRALHQPNLHGFLAAVRSSDMPEAQALAEFEARLAAMLFTSGLLIEPLPESLFEPAAEAAEPAPAATPALTPTGAVPGRAALVAPALAARAAQPYSIAFIGPWNFATGLSQASRGYISALWRTGARLNIHPVDGPFHVHKRVAPTVAARDFLGAADAVIIHLNPDAWGALTPEQRAVIDSARVRIGLWVWEMGHVPDEWLPAFDVVDEIWAPSRYCAEVLAAETRKPVSVVPHVVTPSAGGGVDRAAILSDLGLEPDARVVLYAFDGASFLVRKNPHALIRAFAAAGLAERGWRLVLKTKNLMDRPEDGALVARLVAETPGVVLLEKQLDQEALTALFEAADIYASPHRSEGFGLTVAEAMALGKPVVASDYGGTCDFLDASCGFPVPVRVIENDQDSGVYRQGGRWADVDPADFAAALGACADQVEAGHGEIGARARSRIAERLSADAVAGALMAALERALADAPRDASAA